LHFVRTIVTQHGGRVWLTSALGAGSQFYFSLPKSSPQAALLDTTP
jgi:signal transduction histidine kinase